MKISQKETKTQRLTNEQLAERLAGKSCCGKEMILTETHQESGNKVCLKYACSQCNSSLFAYGEKPKKSIILTPRQYESLLTEMKNIYQILYQAKSTNSK